MENEIIQISIEKEIKQKTDEVLRKLGMTTEMAIKIFLNKVIIANGMPFNVRVEDPSDNKKEFEKRSDRGGDGNFREDRGERREGGFRGGDRGFSRGGDRGGFSRGGDRGGFRGGDRDRSRGFRGDRDSEKSGFGDHKRNFERRDSFKDKNSNREEFNLRGNLLDDDRRVSRKNFSKASGDSQPKREREKISFKKNEDKPII